MILVEKGHVMNSDIRFLCHLMDDDIDGEDVYDYSGNAVSLSSGGNTVAIGATANDSGGICAGHVRVYSLKE